MKKSFTRHLAVLLAVVFILGMLPVAALAGAGDDPVTVHLIGDSTIHPYSRKEYPRWGWGQAIPFITNNNVAVFDWAVSGASSRTIYEGIWSSVIDAIQEGDYLFIQFGHNDQKSENTKVYAPLESAGVQGYNTYEYYLNNFISETKAKGAHPIIVTSIERLNVLNKDTLTMGEGALKPYADAAIAVANAAGIPYVDLRSLQREYLANCATYDEAFQLYMASQPGENNYMKDYTHLTAKGATVAARLVFGDLKRQNHVLGNYLLDEGTLNPGTEGYYVKEDFTNATSRGPLAKPFEYDNEAYIFDDYNNAWKTSIFTEEGGNKALKFNALKQTSGERILYMPFKNADGTAAEVSSGSLAIEFDVKMPLYDAENGETTGYAVLNNSDWERQIEIYVKNMSNGICLTSSTGTVYKKIPDYTGGWVNVKTLINLDNGTCITYFNGTPATKRSIEDTVSFAEIGVSAVPQASVTYNECSFDNIKVYPIDSSEVPALTDPSVASAVSIDIDYLMYEQFEWDEYDTTIVPETTSGSITAPERQLVHKAGSAIPSIYSYTKDFRPEGISDGGTAANIVKYQPQTSIVTDSDPNHGKVFKFETNTTKWSGRRAITLNRSSIPNTDSNYRVLEFDFKFDKDTVIDDTDIYVEYAGAMIALYKRNFQLYSSAKKFSNSEEIGSSNYAPFAAEVLNDGNIQVDKWYTIKFLFDRVTRQYDIFLDNVLIAQDIDVPTVENGETAMNKIDAYTKPSIGMVTAYKEGTKAFYLDNIIEYDATDEQAVAMAKTGVEKFIGNTVYAGARTDAKFSSSEKSGSDIFEIMDLPFAGITGFNYFASSTDKVLDTNLHTPHVSYEWSIEGNNDFEVERKTYLWEKIVKDPSLPPYQFNESTTYEMWKNADLNYDLSSGKPVDVNTSSPINPVSLFGYSRIKHVALDKTLPVNGYTPDMKFTLNVNITKGSATDTLSKEITLQRPTLTDVPEGITVGVPMISMYNQTTYNMLEGAFKTYVTNSTDSEYSLSQITAFFDDEDNLIYAIKNKSAVPSGEGKEFFSYPSPGRLICGNNLDAEESVMEAARALNAKISYAKFYLWNDSTQAPLMGMTHIPVAP